jgi:hypothetical protein
MAELSNVERLREALTAPAGLPARTAKLARKGERQDVASNRIAREDERPEQDAEGRVAWRGSDGRA